MRRALLILGGSALGLARALETSGSLEVRLAGGLFELV